MKTNILILITFLAICGTVVYIGWDRKYVLSDDNEWEKKPSTEYFGWDLSYEKVLSKNKLDADASLPTWLKNTDRTESKKLLDLWDGEPIIESILIESPDFHAGDPYFTWLFRTQKQAYLWESSFRRRGEDTQKKTIDMKQFDKAFKEISSLSQAKPKPFNEGPESQRKFLSGYMGFMNVYGSQGSRQILLTFLDFIGNAEEGEPGRVLKPINDLNK